MWRNGRAAGALAAATVLTAALSAAPVSAAEVSAAETGFDPLPMKLPSAGAHASADAQRTWILGIRPSAQAQRIAAHYGAQRIIDVAVSIPAGRAREAAAALKRAGELSYAEPDVKLRRASSYDGHPEQWARAAIVPPDLPAPAPPGDLRVGVIDDEVDVTLGDLAAHTTQMLGGPVRDAHGTQVTSVVSAAVGNGGVMGVFPSVPILSYGTDLSCADVARGVSMLDDFGAQVINIGLGSPYPCVTQNIAIQQAIGHDIIVVAAAGNEFELGNQPQFPAAFPHVLSVAAVLPDWTSAWFSNANAAVDISAPGVGVPVATPLAFDVEDGVQDGMSLADGTSFAAPMVTGAAAWVRAVRGDLSGMQVADVLRSGSYDVGPRGWDSDFGWGVVNIPGALGAPVPPVDPFEPNDDMPYVNGTYFQGADPPVYRGSSRRLVASVDFAEDPYDVYRFRMPGHSALRATLRPRYGDPDLYAFHGGARSLRNRRAIVDRSERAHGADRVFLRNTGRRSALGYLVVSAPTTGATIDSRYSLSITRTHYRR